jgi:glycosyltransferase involved in cell wall biosynthesis
MRIAVVNWTRRRLGGVESYLDAITPALAEAGPLAMLYEEREDETKPVIRLPPNIPRWSVATLGAERVLELLREWRPDILYVHRVADSRLEAALLDVAPSVFFVHDYHGTCISGRKTFALPTVTPCDRTFGWPCLLYYFPRRCGGRSPVTMVKLYRLQRQRLRLLRRYDAVVTHSEHMLREYLRHGLAAEQIYNFPYYVRRDDPDALPVMPEAAKAADAHVTDPPRVRRLVFAGRMEFLKGGAIFLDALCHVTDATGWPFHVVFAGDGRERQAWERKAARVRRGRPSLLIEFVGWVERRRMDALLDSCDLLVVPSVWPEPFGLIGPEAGLRGVPTAAFAVGGIRDWLIPGVNGYLAPGNPPTAEGLAQAITECLRDPAVHARLRRGAVQIAQQFSIANHRKALMAVFERVIERRRAKP